MSVAKFGEHPVGSLSVYLTLGAMNYRNTLSTQELAEPSQVELSALALAEEDGLAPFEREDETLNFLALRPRQETSETSKSRVAWKNRIAGSAMFVGLALLSLVEGVVRLALAAVAFVFLMVSTPIPIPYVMPISLAAYGLLFASSVVTFENFVSCCVGSVKSFSSEQIEYEKLVPCIDQFNEAYSDAFIGPIMNFFKPN